MLPIQKVLPIWKVADLESDVVLEVITDLEGWKMADSIVAGEESVERWNQKKFQQSPNLASFIS